jgi:hypothetical protein
VDVELDIFSGVPNPTWTLTPVEAEELLRRLAALPPAPPGALSGHLGYRGVILTLTEGVETQLVRVQRGLGVISSRGTDSYRRDADRALERWLLDTGGPAIGEGLWQVVRRDLP